MKEIFEIKPVRCIICDTPIDGRYRRGNKFYCFDDYQRTSPQEIRENNAQLKKLKLAEKLNNG